MYQRCPICKGKGILKLNTCPTCLGERIIHKDSGIPPSRYVALYIPYIPYSPCTPTYPWDNPIIYGTSSIYRGGDNIPQTLIIQN